MFFIWRILVEGPNVSKWSVEFFFAPAFCSQHPPTSSILGAPPTKYPVYGPPSQGSNSSSILGNAPAMQGPGPPGNVYNSGNQRIVSPLSFQTQPPQTVQQAPPTQQPSQSQNQQQQNPGAPLHQQQPIPPLSNAQSSILGQPPTPPHHVFPGGLQNFHNVPPRPHGHGQHPVNQPVPVYGHPIEPGQAPPPMQGVPQSSGLIQQSAPPPYGGVLSYPPVSVPNGQPGLNFGGGHHIQNMVKEPFQNSLEPSMLPPQGPPGVQGGQFMVATTTEYPKFGMGHLYSAGKVDISSDVGLGIPGVQTMLLPSNAESSGRQQQQQPVRPGLVPLMNPTGTESLLSGMGIHISQLGGLNVAQVEGDMSGGGNVTPGLGGKMPPSGGGATSMDAFALHHPLSGEGSAGLHTGGLGAGTILTPSTSNIVMAPAVFSVTGSETNLPAFNSARPSGTAGGVVPIGSERAQKATLSAFPGIYRYLSFACVIICHLCLCRVCDKCVELLWWTR